jgi:curved DNA-binding protein CbpA
MLSRQILPQRLLLPRFPPQPRCPAPSAPYISRASRHAQPFSQSARHHIPRHEGHGSHYDALGVPHNATPVEVKKAFYALSKTSHPDHNRDDPTAAKRFSRISEAYSILGTPAKRAKYDISLGHDVAANRPVPRGSYHSTGPAGGRPASGLSRRRTRFYGPPPSYQPSSHAQHADSAAGADPHHSTGHAHGHGTHGGMGHGPHPYTRPIGPDEIPYFDKESHHRTHSNQDQRRTERVRERAAYHRAQSKGQPSTTVNFFIFSSVLAFAMTVPVIADALMSPKASKTKSRTSHAVHQTNSR